MFIPVKPQHTKIHDTKQICKNVMFAKIVKWLSQTMHLRWIWKLRIINSFTSAAIMNV